MPRCAFVIFVEIVMTDVIKQSIISKLFPWTKIPLTLWYFPGLCGHMCVCMSRRNMFEIVCSDFELRLCRVEFSLNCDDDNVPRVLLWKTDEVAEMTRFPTQIKSY